MSILHEHNWYKNNLNQWIWQSTLSCTHLYSSFFFSNEKSTFIKNVRENTHMEKIANNKRCPKMSSENHLQQFKKNYFYQKYSNISFHPHKNTTPLPNWDHE